MLELAIRGGLVFDGVEGPPSVADVGIVGGRIVEIGESVGAASRVLDASGLIVTPGFIDSHTHSDFTLPMDAGAPAKLLQGITTDVTGNCGFSPFPLDGSPASERHGNFFAPAMTERWPTLAAYAQSLTRSGIGINVAPLVGLGAIRLNVMGEDSDRAPTEAELHRMQRLLQACLADGASGASSGLIYSPSGFAGVDELAALAGDVARSGAVYATHMRDEAELLDASIREALETVRRSGCSLQISHLKAFGKPNWGAVARAAASIDDANARGSDVWFDVYPYTAGATSLSAALPPSALVGGEPALKARLADPEARKVLARSLAENREKPIDQLRFARVDGAPELAGKRVVDAAASRSVAAPELVLSVLESEGVAPVMIVEGMSEVDVRTALTHPRALFGSDGWVMNVDREPYAHPRNFAAAIRLLAHYVRDLGVLDLGPAIAMMTSRPARRFRLADRGRLTPGAAADISVLDLQNAAEQADFEHPCVYPKGVWHVVVNGRVAVEAGQLTGERAGRVLSREAH